MAVYTFLILFLVGPALAYAGPLTNQQKACVFKKPVVIGASISAGTAMMIPLYGKMTAALGLRLGVLSTAPFGPSPVGFLLSGYARTSWLGNGTRDYSVMFTQSSEDWGSTQVRRLIEGSERKVFDQASVIFGIDAFYWDAIQDNCGNFRNNAEPTILRLIEAAQARGAKLILGNVPHEDPSKVIIDSEAINIPGLWYPPETSCALSINQTLKDACTPERGCYVVDLDEMVSRLNKGEKLTLRDGSKHGLYALRPDGVHLSIKGSIFIAERIVEALEANPPQCK